MAGAASSDRLVTSFPLLETADLFQELSLGSDASEVPRNCNKGSLQHQYGHVPYGEFTAPSSHGSERRPNMNVGRLLNGWFIPVGLLSAKLSFWWLPGSEVWLWPQQQFKFLFTSHVVYHDGTKIIKIFKEHLSKTCILDDFKFYGTRQKIIRDKKIKQKKQAFDGTSGETSHLS